MITYKQRESARLEDCLCSSPLATFSDQLQHVNEAGWSKILTHGDVSRWQSGFDSLPDVAPSEIHLNASTVKIGLPFDTSDAEETIESALKKMHPWRKGPFELFGVHIDTEWRSDWKWDRLKDDISPLIGRTMLDVGCGSGYHLWRMLGAGAKLAIGIDPTALFAMQFAALKRYQPDAPAFILPVGIEAMPVNMTCFDTVFSMGILYHRHAPIDHLLELKSLLRSGGELVLDTLVVEGDEQQCLMPQGRYAKMRNVWFIPSVAMLGLWLKRAGFKNIRTVDISPTSSEEQRSTAWMTFESLADFLDPNDSNRTIEGYPAPVRSILTAQA
jgi:tRNA (mo5U34)-methyltransferase